MLVTSQTSVAVPVMLETIDDRNAIRSALQHGDVDQAIERANDLDPSLLEKNPVLFFHLQKQVCHAIFFVRVLEFFAETDRAYSGKTVQRGS